MHGIWKIENNEQHTFVIMKYCWFVLLLDSFNELLLTVYLFSPNWKFLYRI